MKKTEHVDSVFLNPFLLSPEKLAEFIQEHQGQIIGQTLVDWHNFAIVSKKTKGLRLIAFQKKEGNRDDRLKLVNSLLEEDWKEVCVWAMGAIKLEVRAKKSTHEVNFTMPEEENLSPSLVQVFIPFMAELSRLLIPHLGEAVELNFYFSKIEDTHHAYLIKAIPKKH